MHNKGLKMAEINKDLAFLPENRLDEVKNFVTFILSQDKDKRRKIGILFIKRGGNRGTKYFSQVGA